MKKEVKTEKGKARIKEGRHETYKSSTDENWLQSKSLFGKGRFLTE